MGCFGSKNASLSKETVDKLKQLFDKIDADGSGQVTKTEALQYWSSKFGKASVDQMFGQTDEDQGQTISMDEFMKYWQQVKKAGYSEQEIREEVQAMIDGEVWRDWGKVKITATPKGRDSKTESKV
eukprot:gnl/TRDRNA2_/TRDRNA2_195085_c0_seq1.p2 gnl/TRDRNA2_/TRDRNA2_195085_c0~~gnl/TRDRNA2_/TRDRNA2_195085_c0_seq1.p2  ORF type:complete len:126 (-),score=35.33 gnl/TRDRNA2_/TRDRNA2_195085_c0_seq1:103-480(-)